MPLTDDGRDHIAEALVGESPTPFGEANAHIGVGDSGAVFSSDQSSLEGASTERKAMDAGYPQRTDNEMVFRATFGTEEANFDWEEWGIFNASTGGTMLNRAVESLGTKPDTQSWQFTTTLTVNNP